MKHIKLGLLLFLFSSFSAGIFAQPFASGQIEALVARTMKTFDVPGMAVAVVNDGHIIHEKGYGVFSLKTMQKVNEHTLFGIASNTKAFTVMALGILALDYRGKPDGITMKPISALTDFSYDFQDSNLKKTP